MLKNITFEIQHRYMCMWYTMTTSVICFRFFDFKTWGQRKSWPWPECINSDCNNGVLCDKKNDGVLPNPFSFCGLSHWSYFFWIPFSIYIYPFPTAGTNHKSKKHRMGAGPVGMALAEAVSKGVSWYHCLTSRFLTQLFKI